MTEEYKISFPREEVLEAFQQNYKDNTGLSISKKEILEEILNKLIEDHKFMGYLDLLEEYQITVENI